jgi:hypothetical protein
MTAVDEQRQLTQDLETGAVIDPALKAAVKASHCASSPIFKVEDLAPA